MGKYWGPLERKSSWRKIALGMWDAPADPTIYGHETIEVTEALRYLDAVREASGVKVTMPALVVKCFAEVYRDNPLLNVIIVNGNIHQRHSVDAFCQVAIPSEEKGNADLSGVKLANVSELDVVAIAQKLRGKAKKIKDGQDEELAKTKSMVDWVPPMMMRPTVKLFDWLTFNVPFDVPGVRSDPFGTYMVSSVAQFGIKVGFAPLVPSSRCPMVCVVGAVHDAPFVIDGEVVARKAMTIAATFDHRCYDGYQIGFIVREFKAAFTDPFNRLDDPAKWGEASSGDEASSSAVLH